MATNEKAGARPAFCCLLGKPLIGLPMNDAQMNDCREPPRGRRFSPGNPAILSPHACLAVGSFERATVIRWLLTGYWPAVLARAWRLRGFGSSTTLLGRTRKQVLQVTLFCSRVIAIDAPVRPQEVVLLLFE